MQVVIGVVLVTAVGLLAGLLTGNQPRRDAVAWTRRRFGIELESRRISVGEVSLHVVLAGPHDGRPVVLLHGYPEFWYAWRGPMVVLARAGFRVIVPDQRGYNLSDKPRQTRAYKLDKLAGDVIGLADALGYRKVLLGGHDFGGLVSWWTVLLHPERVEKLAVINKPHPYAGHDYVARGKATSWYRSFLRLPWIPGYVARLGPWAILARNLRKSSLPDTFPAEEMDLYRSAWDHAGAIHTMGAWYRANANFAVDLGSPRVAVPTLVLLAPDDSFTPSDLATRSSSYLDDGRVEELDAGTHWVIQERPVVVGEALARFFS